MRREEGEASLRSRLEQLTAVAATDSAAALASSSAAAAEIGTVKATVVQLQVG